MTSAKRSGAVAEVDRLLRGGTAAGLDDRLLLERIALRRDDVAEMAWAALVGRHAPMVARVCGRFLRDPGAVGDAVQGTFLVLLRRAATVRCDETLGPWLHGVSVRVASRARAQAARRGARERTNLDAPEPIIREEADDLRAVIDEEVARLPGRYRGPIVLCHLDGLSHEEAASRLGCPVGTVRSRLSRGRDLLRPRLARRGLGALALASALAGPAARAEPPLGLIASTARLARRGEAGRLIAGTVPAAVADLADGACRAMTISNLARLAKWLAAPAFGALGLAAMAAPPAPSSALEPAQAAAPTAPAPPDRSFDEFPAFVVTTTPAAGATDVDSELKSIEVTYSKDMMDRSWSWSNVGKDNAPEPAGKPSYADDKRTCRLPVKLAPGRTYALFLNSPKFGNFKDASGKSAVPFLLVFRTRK